MIDLSTAFDTDFTVEQGIIVILPTRLISFDLPSDDTEDDIVHASAAAESVEHNLA